MSTLWTQIGINWWQTLGLFVAATVLFWLLTATLAIAGQRLHARLSVPTVVLMTVIGAVTARAMLGPSPTLLGGIVVLGTLFMWEALTRRLTRLWASVRFGQARRARAIAVMHDGVVDSVALARARMQHGDLMEALRRREITQLATVRLAIVERDGSITVVKAGEVLDAELFADVDLTPVAETPLRQDSSGDTQAR